jgi:hypothetical protein
LELSALEILGAMAPGSSKASMYQIHLSVQDDEGVELWTDAWLVGDVLATQPGDHESILGVSSGRNFRILQKNITRIRI